MFKDIFNKLRDTTLYKLRDVLSSESRIFVKKGFFCIFLLLSFSMALAKDEKLKKQPEKIANKSTGDKQEQTSKKDAIDKKIFTNSSKEERFGMAMGVTKLEEAKEILRKRGAEFKELRKGSQITLVVAKDPLIEEYIPSFKRASLEFTFSERLFGYEIFYKGEHRKRLRRVFETYVLGKKPKHRTTRFLQAAFLEKGFKEVEENFFQQLRNFEKSIYKQNSIYVPLYVKNDTHIRFSIGSHTDSIHIFFEPLRNQWENGDQLQKGIKEM